MKLVFVYNADTGFFNLAADIAHKIFSPRTYPCSLCGLTYGVFQIRPEWEAFVREAPAPFEFLHRDEFQKQYPDWKTLELPAVLSIRGEQAEILIPSAELNGFTSIQDLKSAILQKIAA